uniref:Uncharacterized protein n=1 Tax=Rhizophora mucronata TaxID=61149 RepID=A0A2P2QXF3_RHIMU
MYFRLEFGLICWGSIASVSEIVFFYIFLDSIRLFLCVHIVQITRMTK